MNSFIFIETFLGMSVISNFKSCILGGIIGDAYGSTFEGVQSDKKEEQTFYAFGAPEIRPLDWCITDDTQLTLATCESIVDNDSIQAEAIAATFLEYFKKRKITGIGASTLKAMRELEVGGHWSQVGRRGEFAAGNGAAMRIAPLAFFDVSNQTIRDVCSITHVNDEAYAGAMAVIIAIRSAVNGAWTGKENLLEIVAEPLPDTQIKDRLLELKDVASIAHAAQFGNDGYAVNSVPFALAAANQVTQLGMKTMYDQIIQAGGDTDTNASIAGQIAGSLLGLEGLPLEYVEKVKALEEWEWMEGIIERTTSKISY